MATAPAAEAGGRTMSWQFAFGEDGVGEGRASEASVVLGEMVVTGIRSEDSRGLGEAAEMVVKAEGVAILMMSIVVARNSMLNGSEVIGYSLNHRDLRDGRWAYSELNGSRPSGTRRAMLI